MERKPASVKKGTCGTPKEMTNADHVTVVVTEFANFQEEKNPAFAMQVSSGTDPPQDIVRL